MKPVSAVIPNWNGAARLTRVLACLQAQTHPLAEIFVIDNGSNDDSISRASQAGARVIPLGINRGFAYAVNRGIEAASGDWIAILNNDVELPPEWLSGLITEAESRSAWFAVGKLLDARSRDRIDGTYDLICRGGCAWRCGAGCADGPLWNDAKPIRFAPLTAALFRAEVFRRVGMLDENYGSYLEDVDLGLRCAAAGLDGVYAPAAVGYHQGSATLGRWSAETVRLIARNQVLLVKKHWPAGWWWPVLMGQALWGLLAVRHGAGLAWLHGKWDGFRVEARLKPCATAIIQDSERELLEMQRRSGFDWYWRIYSLLT